ncbi:maleylpyruvate isomerase N-terminal domain-containing protein [Lysobacter korlensis]|uniref:Maleylpyruvate isomerase N-terminal domain-containing protein n=1 Tax=Lysobacter korlensis TaxID=553636 RepID=A0ABV6RNJ1_9GAMM
MDPLAEVERVTGAFAAELDGADPAAPLQAVRWTVQQVAAHLGAVHRWAALNARTGHRNPRVNVPELDVTPAEWYAEARSELLGTLHELDPDARCYTLSRTDKTVRFWHRRQLHESLIHLWDLRSRNPDAEPPGEVSEEVWIDTVDELFDVFLPRSSAADRLDLGGTLRIVATGCGREWVFARDWSPGEARAATATVAASPASLALFVWNRLDLDAVDTEGDPDVVARFRRAHIRP